MICPVQQSCAAVDPTREVMTAKGVIIVVIVWMKVHTFLEDSKP